jgi:hypothetical protein
MAISLPGTPIMGAMGMPALPLAAVPLAIGISCNGGCWLWFVVV